MLTSSQVRRTAVLDHLIAGRLEPRQNIMQEPKFLPGIDQYLDEYFHITRAIDEISAILLRFGISDEKKRSIFYRLVGEHAHFVKDRFLPLAPYSEPEVLLFYVTARRRHMSYSEIGRMIERYFKESYSAGFLMDDLWRHFERFSFGEDHEFEP